MFFDSAAPFHSRAASAISELHVLSQGALLRFLICEYVGMASKSLLSHSAQIMVTPSSIPENGRLRFRITVIDADS